MNPSYPKPLSHLTSSSILTYLHFIPQKMNHLYGGQPPFPEFKREESHNPLKIYIKWNQISLPFQGALYSGNHPALTRICRMEILCFSDTHLLCFCHTSNHSEFKKKLRLQHELVVISNRKLGAKWVNKTQCYNCVQMRTKAIKTVNQVTKTRLPIFYFKVICE